MTGVSVLTLARGRTAHLLNLIEGLRRCAPAPDELIVVDMNDAPLELPSTPFPLRLVRLAGGALPLAAARNLAARSARNDRLLFLDADCIPARGVVGAVDRTLRNIDGLVCPEALYLGENDARGPWTETKLLAAGRPHPARPFPREGLRLEGDFRLFWSLAFGIRRATFEAIGGFDEAFTGYGGEDTDFGLRADAFGVPLVFMGGPGAFHQHHAVSDPPVEHLADIVGNARRFRRKWGWWPMEGWLTAFGEAGLISFDAEEIRLISERAA